MKPIIVTYSNESWVVNGKFGQSFICRKLIGNALNLISKVDIKLIARQKQKDKTPVTNY